ncbi:MAG: signal recognition particle receptor subunit alpha, partial [Alphaproteobacteria bacterium]|nr:signal recognition particle receptor subunit alpha [Alphaproteobacteria bacterium]
MFWFSKLKKGLKKTSDSFREIFISKDMKEALTLLEEKLILCDMGISTAEEIVKMLKEQNIKESSFLKEELKKILIEKLTGAEGKVSLEGQAPRVFLFFGVNGSGKTTTIGKLAEKINNQKKKVLLIAADTFRAAAIEQ